MTGPGPVVLTLPMDTWRHPRPGDDSVVERCTGPTLDVGCGPGRIAYAVAAAGVPALGIDVSGRAVAAARARGASALRRDVFGRIPAAGRWRHVLLIDGNIGIAGDPLAVLQRCRDAVCEGGTILAEVEPPGTEAQEVTLRLVGDGWAGEPLPWARVGIDAVPRLASRAGLHVVDSWCAHGRWFVGLRRRRGVAHRPWRCEHGARAAGGG